MSFNELLVLSYLAARSPAGACGVTLMRALGIASGALYPLLARLHGRGLLTAWGEAGSAREHGRPLRRYYAVTARGHRAQQQAHARLTAAADVGPYRVSPRVV